ncbi:MAG: fibronectin type III domain-containing protein [Terriglobales bacterium]|jgi:purple acid phosphatase-like protein
MNKVHGKLLLMAAIGSLLFPNPIVAQDNPYSPKAILPPEPKAARVQITQGPELEIARASLAIIRWTTNNPGGADVHFGIVHYGTNPNELNQTAKSPIHLNRSHSDTVFRVRVLGLSPQTTYYYTVDSTGSDGTGDGVKSTVKDFSTP